jgi:simple sugar transport system permease protein
MQEPSGAYPQSDKIPEAAQLPILLPGQRLHLGFAIAITLAAVAAWYFRKSASGFRLTITGMSPTVAASAGLVNVGRTRFRALIASGAIAGLAGTCEATGVTYMLFEGLSPGYGYAAIGVALLGELRPGGIVAAAVLFGMLGAGADAMQRDAGVPSELAAVTAAIVILGMLAAPAFARRRARTEPATEAR